MSNPHKGQLSRQSSHTSSVPGSPKIQSPLLYPQSGPSSRHASIVEMLSTPPALPGQEDVEDMNLSREASCSSLSTAASVSMAQSSSSLISKVHLDWQQIPLSELVETNKLIFINGNYSVEEAFKTLLKYNLTSLPVEEFDGDVNCLTFDYNDLNAYLLVVLHKLVVDQTQFPASFQKEQVAQYVEMAQRGEQVPTKFVVQLQPKNPFYKIPESESLSTVMEILGSGVHRVAIVNESGTKITGILSQRRLIKYLWDNARRFPSLEPLLQRTLNELGIGTISSKVISIFGDEPLINALKRMNVERVSSIAVVDRHYNLLGNISVTDVKHVSNSSQSELLYKSCLHFISVILNLRGLEDGKDSFPIFHVYPTSSLARIIAKLVATKSHRLWIVKPNSSPSVSAPPAGQGEVIYHENDGRSGKLIGVVSLTDILGLLARKHGKAVDPNQARKMRRRSSSSTSSGSYAEWTRK